MPTDLRSITAFSDLIRYLEDELDWPLGEYEFEDLTFEYTPDELGLKGDDAAKINGGRIYQLRPPPSGMPWGIFFIEFEKKKLPIVVLRRILGSLAIKKRASANQAERVAFHPRDLLFVTAFGPEEHSEIAFAHFHHDPESPGDLPTLRVLGWDDQDTVAKITHLQTELDKLHWPHDPGDQESWRLQWAKPFRLSPGQVVKTTKELANMLAQFSVRVLRRVEQLLEKEHDQGPLQRLLSAMREGLIHDMTEKQFADMFAQTIAYGLLLQRFGRSNTSTTGLLQLAVGNEFLRDLLEQFLTRTGRRDGLDFDEAGIQEIVDFLDSDEVVIDDILRDFSQLNPQEDPVIHFYEYYLQAYNPKERKKRGVYYTPRPVVSYIVRSVHELLQNEMGLEDGLASTVTWRDFCAGNPEVTIPEGIDPDSHFVTVLDPATGTGTFLYECIEIIERTMKSRWARELNKPYPELRDTWKDPEILKRWRAYVPRHFLPRLFGFEIQMAPYTIAQLKLALKLGETGYRFAQGDRLQLYLTNSLEPPTDLANRHLANLFESLAEEAAAVNEVKQHKRFTVVIGNPPYSPSISEPGWVMRLLDDWKQGLNETKSDLNREEWKFLRLAQHHCMNAGAGIVGFIINRDFLDGIVKRRMREHLSQTFPLRIAVDLNGDVKGNIADENVFEIEQGVAVAILSTKAAKSGLRYTSRVGTRAQKCADLIAKHRIDESLVDVESPPPYFRWMPYLSEHTAAAADEYAVWPQIKAAFGVASSGIQTKRDGLCVAFTREDIWERVQRFHTLSTAQAREEFELGDDGRDWTVTGAKADILASGPSQSFVCPILYRPFDIRFTYWTGRTKGFLAYPRREVMQHILGHENVGMVFNRQIVGDSVSHFSVARVPICHGTFYLGNKGQDYFAPLLAFDDELLASQKLGRSNFTPAFLSALRKAVGTEVSRLSPEEIFHYAYAVFHSPGYRSRYAEFLKIDFPRLPLTGNLKLLCLLARLGGELTALHLLESPSLDQPVSKFIGKNRQVSKVGWAPAKSGTVWIDGKKPNGKPFQPGSSGFQGVSEEVWNFHIGGYQVCEKWLKDRGPKKGQPGRTLSDEDIAHYHKIVVALTETIRLMAEIDEVIETHGGWPGAFQKSAQSEP